ncbi:hypothetical protein LOD99_13854 [Oopsacas minuta]|uniref:N-acetyltransferase domain-containing protein n=1 Tax=Oopsacas minuta TaxID=111878 RepID=A0AAV7KIB9_9METZ|nr:hypothetical protein LOD99_13854 [Oopsacas minuta]
MATGPVIEDKTFLEFHDNDIIVRSWKVEDLPTVLVLCKKFAVTQNMPTKFMTTKKLAEDGFGEHPWFHSWLAETTTSGEPITIGFAMVSLSWDMCRGLVLEGLYTDENWRKKGVARKLVKAVAEFALENSCKYIKWMSLKDNDNANSFYNKIAKLYGPVNECYVKVT